MHRLRTLILLLAAYAAATWFPGPGLWLRELDLVFQSVQTPQVLLAILLFCAGICNSSGALGAILAARARFLAQALAACLLPLVSASLALLVLWGIFACPASVALGIVIVAAMPIANSSVGWSNSLGGSITLSIALLVVGTALSPLLTPLIINAGASVIGTAEQSLTQTPWSDGMGVFFLRWVLLPVLLGVLLAGRLSATHSKRVTAQARRISFSMLILLNYLNGSACLPALTQQPQLLLWPLCGAGVLLLNCYISGQACSLLPIFNSSRNQVDDSERVALLLSVVMRNTGAALVFAGAALPEFVLVSITIIAYTMLQHLWVGMLSVALAVPVGANGNGSLLCADSSTFLK